MAAVVFTCDPRIEALKFWNLGIYLPLTDKFYTVSSATNSTSVTPPLSPVSVVCSTNSSCSSIDNCSIQSSSTNNIQTNTTTTTTTTTTSTTNVCSHNTGQHNDLSGTAELGLHNAFELLDIDSEHWKNQDEKIVDCLKSPVASRFELRVCGAPPSTPSTSPPLAGVGVADAMVSVSGEEPLTGCITSLQKLKLLCQECRKTDSCKCSKIHLKKKVSSSMLDKFNLARSSSSPRGVIKEARFRPHPSDSTEKSVLRASRLKFLSQLNAAKRAKHMANKSTPIKFDEANIFAISSPSHRTVLGRPINCCSDQEFTTWQILVVPSVHRGEEIEWIPFSARTTGETGHSCNRQGLLR
ncbi:unnamed protein product [Acanthosepion pharaonis]|uniref:Uncharacterized protein n=1 Tax=Acanthosepion pharaonis TaxID=158019 RepID=A0A812AP99_ACAPH|nr:unnamed protein product [Sepia pharaonis]